MIDDDTEDTCVLAIMLCVICPPEMDRNLIRGVAERLANQLPPAARERAFSRAEAELDTFAERAQLGSYGFTPAPC